MYVVGFLGRFMEEPKMLHLTAVKRVLRYIKGTLNYGLLYKRDERNGLELVGFSDSDHAGDVDDRRSTTGTLFLLGNKPISWVSQKQKTVALSSCEAEYMAVTATTCQGIWLKRFLEELLNQDTKTVKILVDNRSAITLSKNPVHHTRSKHIELRHHFIREYCEKKLVTLEYVSSEEQLADVLTKALGKVRFKFLLGKLGINDSDMVDQNYGGE